MWLADARRSRPVLVELRGTVGIGGQETRMIEYNSMLQSVPMPAIPVFYLATSQQPPSQAGAAPVSSTIS